MSASSIDRRVASGDWTVLLPGVYALRGSRRSFMRRVVATYEWAGEGTLLSHCTSAVLLELDGITAKRVEITTPRKLRSHLVIVHRRHTEDLPSKRVGCVRITSVEQTLLELAGCLPGDRLELAFDSALRNGSTRIDRVERHRTISAGGESPAHAHSVSYCARGVRARAQPIADSKSISSS